MPKYFIYPRIEIPVYANDKDEAEDLASIIMGKFEQDSGIIVEDYSLEEE